MAYGARWRWGLALMVGLLPALLTACSADSFGAGGSTGPDAATETPVTPLPTPDRERTINGHQLYTPEQMRAAYGLDGLIGQGFSGKGQTVVVIASFGSPTLQADLDIFDAYYDLPALRVQVVAPLGTTAFDASNADMVSWAFETEEDVETIHAVAPQAAIVVLTSPVAEVEGTSGLPQFLQLEQYAAQHYPGSSVSQSWNASEATLADADGRKLVQQWDDFFHMATTVQKMTFFAGTGDWGASNFTDAQAKQLAAQPTSGFPADDPWVTAVGGTTLTIVGRTALESAWPGSGGGVSAFFPTPAYQQALPAGAQTPLAGKRGIPDVAASADTSGGLGIYVRGQWTVSAGTSAGSPVWSALTAIANQKAGHPLGFLNPTLYALGAAPSYAQDFRDITDGSNSVDSGGAQVAGYSAGPGWDAVTGLGSPNATHLIPDLIAAATPTATPAAVPSTTPVTPTP